MHDRSTIQVDGHDTPAPSAAQQPGRLRHAVRHNLTRLVLGCALVTVAAAAVAAGKTKLEVLPFENAKFIPFDPKLPAGAGYAVLSGDPAKGPSQVLMRYGRDGGGMHRHSSDYQAVVIKGIAKHWPEGATEASAKPLAPGGYWSQPAAQLHADACAVDECVIFVTWSGKMD